MKEQAKMGMNRTGVQMSPHDSEKMQHAQHIMAPPSAAENAATVAMRSQYIAESEELGSVPMPGNLKGVLSTGASMLMGNNPPLLLDKLGERLAFERAGTRLYEALITKVQALEQAGTPTIPVEQLRHIRDEEAQHFALVAEAIRSLGGDPTAQTPCADLAGVEAMGLVQAVTDPRTTVAQSLHAILVAEMTDNNGWEMLIAITRDQNHDSMADDFSAALQSEREHLQMVQSWFETATLGAPLSRTPASQAEASGLGSAPLH